MILEVNFKFLYLFVSGPKSQNGKIITWFFQNSPSYYSKWLNIGVIANQNMGSFFGDTLYKCIHVTIVTWQELYFRIFTSLVFLP